MKEVLRLIVIFLAYYVAGKIGLQYAVVHDSATAIWAPTGIALASFLMFGYRVWPAIFLGAFFTNLTNAGTPATSLGIALGNTLEGFFGAYLVNTFAHGKDAFLRPVDIFKYIVAILICTTVSPNIGIISLILGGFANWSEFPSIWFTWWMGDVAGALIVAPFIIFWGARHQLFSIKYRHKLEVIFLFLLLVLISLIMFNGTIGNYPLSFIAIPPVVWISFRFGRREATTAVVILAGFGLWGTLNGNGPFVLSSLNESLLLLQAFMDVTTVTALVLAVAVAQRRDAQKQVLQNEERFRALIEKSSDAMSMTDPQGNIIYVSPSFTRVLGYTPEEVVGMSGMNLIHPDDVQRAVDVTKDIVGKPGSSSIVEIRCKHKDGTWRYIEVTSTNLLDNPNLQAVVSNFHDVTERTMSSERLGKEKAEAQALLESIGDGIIATDPTGKIILVNSAFEEITSWTKKDVMSKILGAVVGMFDEKGKPISDNERPLVLALATGKRITATHYLQKKNGNRFPARITATPVISRKKVIGGVEIFHDITREKELDEAKDEFISLASHEMRTPMTAIKGLITMILEGDYGPINAGLKKPLANIHESSNRQISLINDLLDVSRLQTGKINYSLSDFSIKQAIDEVTLLLEPIATQKGLQLLTKDVTDALVQADIQRVKQVLDNLIGNSLKFTEKGNVTVSCKVDHDYVLITVSDTGVGIDPSEKKKLFGRFRQLTSNAAGKILGSGLGLYISRSFARKMGGDIILETSSIGKGSTFVFSVPKAGTAYAEKVKSLLFRDIEIANSEEKE